MARYATSDTFRRVEKKHCGFGSCLRLIVFQAVVYSTPDPQPALGINLLKRNDEVQSHTVFAYPEAKITEESGGRLSENAIILCCDENHWRFALRAATSLIENVTCGKTDVVICYAGDKLPPAPNSKIRLCKLSVKWNNKEPQLNQLPIATYYRLFLPSLFKAEYRRILYLDSDIKVGSGDFDKIMSVDLNDHPVGAIRDLTQWKRPNEFIQEFRDAGYDRLPYFNAGVLLIDTKKWIEKEIFQTCMSNLTKFQKFLYNNDQSLLNLTLIGCWQELSPVWNWQISSHRWLFDPTVAPFITHFVGRKKPWDFDGEMWPRALRYYGLSISGQPETFKAMDQAGYRLSTWRFLS